MMFGKRGQYGGGKPFFESVVPLILIIILAVFIAAKFNYIDLHSIPLIGSLFPASYIKIVVIGNPSSTFVNVMQSEDYRIAGLTYAGAIRQEAVVPGVLKNFDIVILQGTPICDRTARKVLGDYVKGGGRLLVVGDSCTRVNDDPNAVGWDIGIGSLGDVIPVAYGGIIAHERIGDPTFSADGKFKIVSPYHPIFNGILNFGFYGTLVGVIPNANSDVLAYVDTYGGKPTAPATFAIVESRSMLGGKTMYFAFDPSTTSRNMLMNTLLYMKGAKG